MKNGKRILAFILALACVFLLTACSGKESKYVGTYVGGQGSTLVLRSGGECSYLESNWKEAEDGTWEIDDDILYVSIEKLGYDIYARLEGSSSALLFEADSIWWGDELFVKAD